MKNWFQTRLDNTKSKRLVRQEQMIDELSEELRQEREIGDEAYKRLNEVYRDLRSVESQLQSERRELRRAREVISELTDELAQYVQVTDYTEDESL